jgi:hypothetical protein
LVSEFMESVLLPSTLFCPPILHGKYSQSTPIRYA